MADSLTNSTGSSMNVMAGTFGRRKSDLTALQPIDDYELITVDGKYGVFTPLISGEADAAGDVSQNNSTEVIEALKKEVKLAKQDNLLLKEQIRVIEQKKAKTPDDFVTAIMHSVDSLQSKLSQMTNPVSNFVVRDFKIDTKVYIDVSDLGTIDYRFIQPGDKIDPNTLTNISLTLSPTPKADQIGSYQHPDFTPFEDVKEIQGIGEVNKARLNQHNIYTVSDLLHAGTRMKSKIELASLLEVDQKKLTEWVNHAQLMTVKNIDGRAAEVLYDIGVFNLTELSKQSPEELVVAYNKQVEVINHETVKPVTVELVQSWVKAAQLYTGEKAQQTPIAAETPV